MSECRHLHVVFSGGAVVVLRSCVPSLLLLPRFYFIVLITRALPSIMLKMYLIFCGDVYSVFFCFFYPPVYQHQDLRVVPGHCIIKID